MTQQQPGPIRRQPAYDDAVEDDGLYPRRPPTSTIRYRPLETRDDPRVPQSDQQRQVVTQGRRSVQGYGQYGYDQVNVHIRRRSSQQHPVSLVPSHRPVPRPELQDQEEMETEPLGTPAPATRRPRSRPHWMFYVGIGMSIIVALYIVGMTVLNWWNVYQDDLHYGRPRTFQCDAVVGHRDSSAHPSHFLALNLNRHVEIIEIPGGDSAHMKVYAGPVLYGDGQDLAPVTLSFRDVNGDGQLDMLIHVQGQTIVYLNDNGQFRPARAADKISV